VNLASLPSRRDVNKGSKAMEQLEKKLGDFVEKTNDRLDRLEALFEAKDLEAVDRVLEGVEERENATPPVELLKTMAGKLVALEKRAEAVEGGMSQHKEVLGKLKKAVVDSGAVVEGLKKAVDAVPSVDPDAVSAGTLEASIQFQIEDLHSKVGVELGELSEKLQGELEVRASASERKRRSCWRCRAREKEALPRASAREGVVGAVERHEREKRRLSARPPAPTSERKSRNCWHTSEHTPHPPTRVVGVGRSHAAAASSLWARIAFP
jgi:hypothetical protein